jgi:TonB family protein
MFDKLVVSTAQRRRGRTAKFFVGTSVLYLSAVAVAFALSILLATPKLADTAFIGPSPIFLQQGGPREKLPDTRQTTVAPTRDPRNVEPLDRIITNLANSRSTIVQNASPQGTTKLGEHDGPGDGASYIPGIPNSTGRDASPGNVPPDPPKPDQPKAQTRAADNGKPLPVSSVVLQGKAVVRVVPVYPELPKRIHLQGEVSLEVIISPEGRVESVRVVSGHPMLVNSALEAARGWRFEPTFLNGVAVRVTGVITFAFKLNE